MSSFKHSFLLRESVIERLKAGERIVHRSARNEDGIVLTSTTVFENDTSRITIHPRTFEHLRVHRLIRRVGAQALSEEVFEYSGQ